VSFFSCLGFTFGTILQANIGFGFNTVSESKLASLAYENSFTSPISIILFWGWGYFYMTTALMIVALMEKVATMITWLLKYHVLLGERGLRYAVILDRNYSILDRNYPFLSVWKWKVTGLFPSAVRRLPEPVL